MRNDSDIPEGIVGIAMASSSIDSDPAATTGRGKKRRAAASVATVDPNPPSAEELAEKANRLAHEKTYRQARTELIAYSNQMKKELSAVGTAVAGLKAKSYGGDVIEFLGQQKEQLLAVSAQLSALWEEHSLKRPATLTVEQLKSWTDAMANARLEASDGLTQFKTDHLNIFLKSS